MIVRLIPHTHWDREWYLTRAGFQARLVPVVDALLAQLEQDEAARFVLDGQTVLLEDYLAVRPEARERVAAQVRRGALEVGPWYVLADLLIPAGESLLRNLLEGGRDAAGFGRRMDVLYSPDAFGHPAALPAVARQFGIGRAVVRRGLGRPLGGDRDFYRWRRGEEEILVYHLPRPGYEVAIEASRRGADLAREWAPVHAELAARSTAGTVVAFLGADHHPLVRDLAAFRQRVASHDSATTVAVSGLGELFDAVKAVDAPGIRGELRRIDGHTWVLQDVHSTRSRLTRRHTRAELALVRVAEPLAALAGTEGGHPRGLLRLAWRALLQSQFHDTLGGSCTDGVAREQDVRLETVETYARAIATGALFRVAGHDPDRSREEPAAVTPRLVLWNPAARERGGVVTAELTFFRKDLIVGPPPPLGTAGRVGAGAEPFVLAPADGRSLPVQLLGRREDYERLDAEDHHPDQDEVDRVFVAFEAPALPGLGLAALTPRAQDTELPALGLEVRDRRLSNRYLEVSLAEDGTLSLTDKRTGRRFEGIGRFVDEPDRGDTYTFSRGPGAVRQSGRPRSFAVLASGPLVGAIEARWKMPSAGQGELELRLVVVLHHDSPLVRLRLDIENRAVDHRLRFRVPIGGGSECVAGAAFGTERRTPVTPDRRKGQIEYPVRTAPGQRFAAAGDARGGLAVLGTGFFELEWTAEREILVTLMRSIGELSQARLSERPGHAGWPEPTPLAQEPGPHRIELAVAPLLPADLEDTTRLERLWEDAFVPIQAVFLRQFAAAEPAPSPARAPGGIVLEGEGLVFSAVKVAEAGPGLVLRCWNARDRPTRGRWRFAAPVARAVLVRGDEREIEPLPPSAGGRGLEFSAGPHAIVTVLVETA